MAASLTSYFAKHARELAAAWPPEPSIVEVNNLLRLLGRWRSQALANTFITHHGPRILAGPFEGMEFVQRQTDGPLCPKLLGTYESELHPHLAAIVAGGVDRVVDIGCAEGYYAVGLARALPHATVYAHDILAVARDTCAALAAHNGVAERVLVGGEFRPQDFQAFADHRTLVIVDTEGAEVDILRPDLAPALAAMSIIVETHDLYRPGALATLTERFAPTHEVVRVDQAPKLFELPAWLQELAHLDQLLAVWEWRAGPTPWLVMTPKPD